MKQLLYILVVVLFLSACSDEKTGTGDYNDTYQTGAIPGIHSFNTPALSASAKKSVPLSEA